MDSVIHRVYGGLTQPKEIPMDPIRLLDESTCQVLLTCGHYSEPMSVASSSFDFPSEAMRCDTCKADRQMDLLLQHALMQQGRCG